MKLILEKIITKFEEEQPEIVLWQIKVVCAVVLVYKLLSRDFSNFGFWPESVLLGYPFDIYTPDYILLTAIPPLFDLTTFHFIHWFIPLPSAEQFYFLQNILILAAIALAVSPIRYTRMLGIVVYVICIYLWGFVYRAGQEIDAMFLIQGCLFVLAVIPRKANKEKYSGYVYSSVLLIFVFYYFFSGVNKIIDLSLIEWLQFDLLVANASLLLAFQELNYRSVFEFPDIDFLPDITYTLSAAITYFVHLAAPMIFFQRTRLKLIFYWFFYSLFHLMTGYVGILFTANFFVWLAIIPLFPDKKIKLQLGK
jgi:hypothetical protein